MVVPQFDKFEEKNPDINPESKTPKKIGRSIGIMGG